MKSQANPEDPYSFKYQRQRCMVTLGRRHWLSSRQNSLQSAMTAIFLTTQLDILKATDISEAWKPQEPLSLQWPRHCFQEGKVNSTWIKYCGRGTGDVYGVGEGGKDWFGRRLLWERKKIKFDARTRQYTASTKLRPARAQVHALSYSSGPKQLQGGKSETWLQFASASSPEAWRLGQLQAGLSIQGPELHWCLNYRLRTKCRVFQGWQHSLS